MKNKLLVVMMMLCSVFFSIGAFAYTPPDAPSHGGYVVDQTGVLTTNNINDLNIKIDKISKSTANEIAVLMIDSVGNDSIEDIGYETFKKWGVGKKGLDNGVLIVIAVSSKKARIETGKGTTGEITDIQAKQIITDIMRPQFRAGNMMGCVSNSIDAIAGLLENKHKEAIELKAKPVESKELGFGGFVLILFGIASFIGLGVYLFSSSKSNKTEDESYSSFPPRTYDTEDNNLHTITSTELEEKIAEQDRKTSMRPKPPITVPPRPNSVRPVSLAPGMIAAGVAGVAVMAVAESERRRREKEEERRAQERRNREEENNRRNTRSSYDDSSSSSIFSSSDSGSSDWGSSGGGFGGGDCGGSGSSGDL